MQGHSSLRAITNRLTVTPAEDLPRICGFLANQLANCSLESQFSDLKGSSSSVAAHKLKTRISALLQDRTASGRLTAAVLIKAVVENGGQNVLSASESWARGLLGCLNKPDANEIKKLYLVTITRIFLLTQDQPHLVREITTPLLPHFIKTCLGLIKPHETQIGGRSARVPSPLLDTVLKCWAQLLPQHAPVFRPELARIKAVCHGVVGAEGSSISSRDLAIRLLCLLLSCAPKNSLPQEWSQTATKIINSAHETADNLFRAVLEEYESNDPARQKSIGKQDFSKEPRLAGNDSVGLGPWNGIHQGSMRLSALLTWLGSLLSTPTSQAVAVPVGAVIDLTTRISAMTDPPSPEPLRYHKEASKEEKEELRMYLPSLHVSCLHLLYVMCRKYGLLVLPMHRSIASQAIGLLQALPSHEGIRQGVYDIFGYLMEDSNPNELALSRDQVAVSVTECCHDLRRGIPGLDTHTDANDATDGALRVKPDHTRSSAQEKSTRDTRTSPWDCGVQASAWSLLPKLLKRAPTSLIPRQLRAEMDRLSVLLDHREAMLSSVMRPVLSKGGKASTPSLLPFLARSAGNDLAVEALFRPRMPVIQIGASAGPDPSVSQLSTDQRSEERDPDHADDASSQSDDSMSEQGSSSLKDDGDHETGEGVKNTEDRGPVPDIGTKKRTFVDIAETPEEAVPAEEAADRREVKRPRPEETAMQVRPSAPQGDSMVEEEATEPKLTSSRIGGVSQAQARLSASQTVFEPSATRLPAADHDGEDSDDSEIPSIDAGFDTDEEEEEDDDEEQ
ncbi:hypothetical protein A1O1_07500 [Capronia coronata CBS 617.96]|uniref:Pre-rRNA-processing protein RIX1 n=1 Tax=Capronia coronata CBS 617.96 TaxID=1182541 RepID=W9XTL8_9EURO|nr:uncharacterized protein A1O1_07500 [Capronia coronata CBS 617.96]EXJ83872.1 hypothetical protein A1O1_07500 [Capronia coronata CBS 617.96]